MSTPINLAGKKYAYVSADIYEYAPEMSEKEKATAIFFLAMADEFGKGSTVEFGAGDKVTVTYGKGSRKPAEGTYSVQGETVVIKDAKDYGECKLNGDEAWFLLPLDANGTKCKLVFKEVK